MITWISPMMAGAAIHLILTPPTGAIRWRLLRRTADAFTGFDDTGAVLVHEGTDNNLVDTLALVNGTTYFYRAYWFDGIAWHQTASRSAAPAYEIEDWSTDVMSVLRERIASGLAAEIARGGITHSKNLIEVLTAPPLADAVVFPVVTLRLMHESPAERGIGEDIPGFVVGDASYLDWGQSEGWLSKVIIEVVGWSLNPDERLNLRRLLRRIVLANLPIFDDKGMILVEFEQRDQEDTEQFNAPVYQTVGTFSCEAPAVVVGDSVTPIRDVPVTVNSSR